MAEEKKQYPLNYTRDLFSALITVAIVLSGAVTIVAFFGEWYITMGTALFITLTSSLGFLLLHRGHIFSGINLALFSLLLAISVGAFLSGGLRDLVMLLFPTVILLSGMLFAKRFYYLYAGLTLLLVLAIGLAEPLGWQASLLEGHNVWMEMAIVLIIMLGTILATYKLSDFFLQTLSNLTDSERELKTMMRMRQQREVELRKSEGRWRTLVNSAPDLIFELNSKGIIEFFNIPAQRHLVGTSFFELLPGHQVAMLEEKIAMVLGYGERATCEAEIQLSKVEARRWYICNLAQLEDSESDNVILIASDISERRQAEERLRASEIRYKKIFENIQDIYCEVDMEGNILNVNPVVEKITQYKTTELIGRPGRDIVVDGKRQDEFFRQLWENESISNFEIVLKDKDGRRGIFACNASFFVDEEGRRNKIAISLHEISTVKKLQERLHQAQHMESIGQLAGGIAHDFNNLLTVINGHSQLLRMRLSEDHPAKDDVEAIEKAGSRAALLTRQLLGFSRKQTIQPEAVNLNDDLEQMEKLLSRLATEEIEVTLHLDAELRPIRADRKQLEQVVINLIINARDAIQAASGDKSGQINIRTLALRGANDSDIHHTRLEVSDNGIGIKEADKQRIFEPFFTTKEAGAGTGLGLAMVFGIMQQNKGNIEVESEVGKGSTFRLTWPAYGATQESKREQRIESEDFRGAGSVLLVEDDSAVRDFTAEAIQSAGYDVVTAANGAEGVALCLGENRRDFDLIVSDVIMPVMNGPAMVRKVLAEKPDQAIIFISGYADTHLESQGVLDEDTILIHKPFSTKFLLQSIQKAISKQGKSIA
jgi:PAS domain S-box-containing protein